ncbi:hypothetical protein [Hymenobacter gummosus]|nr:hypothetical protein [Hymenobacter gummosus]
MPAISCSPAALVGANLLFLVLAGHRLNGQSRTITGHVVDELLVNRPQIHIQTAGKVKLGETDGSGRFEIRIPKEVHQLIFLGLMAETAVINLPDSCNTLEVIMLNSGTYDFTSPRKVDRLRLKNFNQLPQLYYQAAQKQLFQHGQPCFSREFIPHRKELEEIAKQTSITRRQLYKRFKALAVGDTIKVPYSPEWRTDGTDRTTLHLYSAYGGRNNFDCVIEGVITAKNTRRKGYNVVYKVTADNRCNYPSLAYNNQPIVPGTVLEYNMKYFKILPRTK